MSTPHQGATLQGTLLNVRTGDPSCYSKKINDLSVCCLPPPAAVCCCRLLCRCRPFPAACCVLGRCPWCSPGFSCLSLCSPGRLLFFFCRASPVPGCVGVCGWVPAWWRVWVRVCVVVCLCLRVCVGGWLPPHAYPHNPFTRVACRR